ncbi:unnamed protein product [Blepharisma stoltei]|uniref:Uncharacterized protein n=1 Tax=Blepharisma stoltei TaxID=1481888 RepID=A0AAU9JR54_9CILI|nr:unnamed protein product [Blepharisma stoltei]
MEDKCCFSGCLDKPQYVCSCDRTKLYCQNHSIYHDNNPSLHHDWGELNKRINDTTRSEVLSFLIEKDAQLNEIKSSILNQGRIDMIISKKMLSEDLLLVEAEKHKVSGLIEKIILAKETLESDPELMYLSMSSEDAIRKFKECALDIEKLKQKIEQNKETIESFIKQNKETTESLIKQNKETIESLIEQNKKTTKRLFEQNNQELNNHISLYLKQKEEQDTKINKILQLVEDVSKNNNNGIINEIDELKKKIASIDGNIRERDELKKKIAFIDKINDSLLDDNQEINKQIIDICKSCEIQKTEINNCQKAIEELQKYSLNSNERISTLEYYNLNSFSPFREPNNMPQGGSVEAISRSELEEAINIMNKKIYDSDKLSWSNIKPWWDEQIKEMHDKISDIKKIVDDSKENFMRRIGEIKLDINELKSKLDEKSDLTKKIYEEKSKNSWKISEFENEIKKIKTDLSSTTLPLNRSITIENAHSINRENRSLPNLKELNKYLNLWKKKEHWLELYTSEISKNAKIKKDMENLKTRITVFLQEYTFLPMSIYDDVSEIEEKIKHYNDFKVALQSSYEHISLDYHEGSELYELLKECEDLQNCQLSYAKSYSLWKGIEQIIDDGINNFKEFVREHKNKLELYKGETIFCLPSTAENRVELISYNIESRNRAKVPTEGYSFPSNTSIIQIPGKQLFFFGFKFPNSQLCCIIRNNFEIVELNYSEISREESSCIYYGENCIYIFGGSDINGLPVAVAELFDLANENEEYYRLPDMVVPARRCSCLRYKDEILICGYEHDKIYGFSVQKKTYYPLNKAEQLSANSDKFLFSGKNKVFIYDMKVGSIFIVDTYHRDLVPIAQNYALNFQSQPYRTYYKNSIYFGFSGEDEAQYFKFNLDPYGLEQL